MQNKQLVELVELAQGGDNIAKDDIIRYFYPLLQNKAKTRSSMWEELAGEWVLKLNDLIYKFDPLRFNNFKGYVWTNLLYYVQEFNSRYTIHEHLNLPQKTIRYLGYYEQAKCEIEEEFGYTPTFNEIVVMLGRQPIMASQIRNIIDKYDLRGSVNKVVMMSSDDDIVQMTGNLYLIEIADELISHEDLNTQTIYSYRIKQGYLLSEVAEKLNISTERVRQIEKKILHRLRDFYGRLRS